MLVSYFLSPSLSLTFTPCTCTLNLRYDPRLASDTLKKLLSIVQSMGPKLIASCKNCGLTTNVVDRLLLHGCQLSADNLQSHLESVLERSRKSKEERPSRSVDPHDKEQGDALANPNGNGRRCLSPTRYEMIRSKKRMELKVRLRIGSVQKDQLRDHMELDCSVSGPRTLGF